MPIARRVVFALFAAALLASPVTASAQNGVGFKVGLNEATFKITPDQPTDLAKRPGLTLGIYVPSPANATAKFQTEILYSEKGVKEKDGDGNIKLAYIDVPILERIKVSGASPLHVHFDVGPVLSYRLKLDATGTEGFIQTKSDTKAYDVGIAVGGDIDVGMLEIDVRYTWGFINILKNPGDFGDAKVTNRVLSCLVGIHSKGK